jgi:hypothetical protein
MVCAPLAVERDFEVLAGGANWASDSDTSVDMLDTLAMDEKG